jgi:hypothetical protein
VDNNFFVQGVFQVGAKIAEITVAPTGYSPRVILRNEITPRVTFGDLDVLGAFEATYRKVRGIIQFFWGTLS